MSPIPLTGMPSARSFTYPQRALLELARVLGLHFYKIKETMTVFEEKVRCEEEERKQKVLVRRRAAREEREQEEEREAKTMRQLLPFTSSPSVVVSNSG